MPITEVTLCKLLVKQTLSRCSESESFPLTTRLSSVPRLPQQLLKPHRTYGVSRRFNDIVDTILVTLLSAFALLGKVTKVLLSLTTPVPCLVTLSAMTRLLTLLRRNLVLTKKSGLIFAMRLLVLSMSLVSVFTRFDPDLLHISVRLPVLT